MGQAKRRKDLGLAPNKTSKPQQRARIKRDNDFMGMNAFPMAMAALLGMMSRRRKSPFQELTDYRKSYRQEDFNEEEYEQIPINIPVEEVEEEDK